MYTHISPAQLSSYFPSALGNCFLKSQHTSFRGKLFSLGVVNKSPRNRTTWIVDTLEQMLCCTLQRLLHFVEMEVAEHDWSGAAKLSAQGN